MAKPADTHPRIVGVGASAGGLRAIQAFLEPVPDTTDLAFAVVVHLSPDHESELAGLLQGRTSLPVVQVRERTKVEPGHVYVVPPDRALRVVDGHLDLAPFTEPRGHRAPIDYFFRTLAEVHDGHSVGVVLSGTGTDGTVGLKQIKERGGLVLVQDPVEAEYDGMPRSAIGTGFADAVLPAAALAERLLAYERDRAAHPVPAEGDLQSTDGEALAKILAVLRARTGHDFSAYKQSTLLRRIGRRMHLREAVSFGAYLEHLRDDPPEVLALLKDLLISVTSFFRDPEAWDDLAQEVVPKLFEGKGPDEAVRVWVAGCATGEEAYSVAMLLAEHADTLSAPPPFQVFASDLDAAALVVAREGLYRDAIEGDVSEERLRRFFRHEGTHYRVSRPLRERVLFAPHNLLKDPPFSRVDLVTCRNLLIYLNRDLQSRVFELFHYALRPGGHLFLGSAESPEGGPDLFRAVKKRSRLYARRDNAAAPPVPALLPAPGGRAGAAALPSLMAGEAFGARPHAQTHYDLLEAIAAPSLLVNDAHDIVHLSPGVGRYLVHAGGTPTSNALKVVRPELRLDLRAALIEAFEHGTSTRSNPVPVAFEAGESRPVVLRVHPGPERNGARSAAVVLFLEGADEATPPAPPRDDLRIAKGMEEQMTLLQDRLRLTVEEYETSVEELRTSNEELQSVNEEYKSALEELETSREELQSVNEELQTVNQELKHKVDELGHVNSDLQNLMASTEIGTLFLDRHLRIKRFTPAITALFNVIATDRGRPVTDVTRRVRYDDLVGDAERVLATLVPAEREVMAEGGAWYLARIRPYRTVEDRIEGVVLTFVDITARREAEGALRASEERHRALVEASAQIVWTTDAAGLVVEDSPSWRAFTGQTFDEWRGEGWANAVHPDDRPAALEHWRQTAATGAPFDTRFRLRRHDGAWRWSHVRAVPLRRPDGALRGWIGMNADVHEQHEADAARAAAAGRVAFQAALGDALRTLSDPVEAQATAVRMLGEHLGVNRASFAEVEPDGEHIVIHRDYTSRVRSLLGRIHLDGFGPANIAAYREGRTLVVSDIADDPALTEDARATFAADIRAFVGVPLVKGGQFVSFLGLHQRTPRAWTPDDVALTEDVAERTWETVERVRVQEALRGSEKRFRRLANAVPFLVWTTDPGGRPTFLNDRWLAYTGQTAEQVLTPGGPGHAIHPDDVAGAVARWQEVSPAAVPYDYEYRIRRHDGAYEWHLVRAEATRDEHGVVVEWVGSAVSIQPIREAERALRASEEQFRVLFASAREYGMMGLAPDRTVELWTPGAERLFGWTAAEAVGRSGDVIFTDEDRAKGAPEQEAATAVETGQAADERWHVRKDGSQFWGSGTLDALREPDGTLRGFVKVLRDNTRRKALDDALRESRERLQLALDAGQLGSWDWDLVGGAVRWTPTHNVLLGIDPDQAEGSYDGFMERVHPDDRARLAAALRASIAEGTPYAEEFRTVHPDGTVRWIAGRGDVTRNEAGEAVRMTGVILDVTDRRGVEEALRSVNALLEDRVAERTEQVRALSTTLLHAEQEERSRIAHVLHDHLQQLLYALQMQVKLLTGGLAGDAAVAGRAETIQRILDEAVSSARSLAVDLSPPVLSSGSLEEALEWIAFKLGSSYGLAVTVETREPLPDPSDEVSTLLFQIVRELLFNAVKHANAERATVTITGDDGHVAVEVADEGVGFDVAAAEAKRAPDGGFGLFSVRDRVRLIGGTTEIDSAPGRGTRITITVPQR